MREIKRNWLATDQYSERTPGLFKPEFVGDRGIFLSSKCYIVQDSKKEKNKYSCKGISKKQNDITWERYKCGLDVLPKVCKIDCHTLQPLLFVHHSQQQSLHQYEFY